MKDNTPEKTKPFKFVKRRLSVHYSIRREIDEDHTQEEKTSKSPTHKRTLMMQEQSIKRLKDIYLRNNTGFFFNNDDRLSDYFETVLDYDSVEDFIKGSYDPEFQKILHILITPYKDRTETDSNNLLSFLSNIKFNETIKSDTLITDLSLNELFEYFKPYISGKLYNFMDTIYYRREKSDNLYIILYGDIGQYKLEKYEAELTCEDYYNFLSDCYNLYEEEMQIGYFYDEKDNPRKSYKITTKSITNYLNGNTNIRQKQKKIKNEEDKTDNNDNKKEQKDEYNYSYGNDDEDKEDDNKEQYIDHYLICQMIEENKEIYPLRDISDLVRLKKIIFKLRLYMVLTESTIQEAEILYILYDFPTSYLNFDRVLNKTITVQKYIEILANNFKLYDYFYIKLLGPEKNKVKLMKYVKAYKNLGPFSQFGNYELNDIRAKRELTVRCESEKAILLTINKKMYSLAIYNAQRKKREQDIEVMHNCYLFKNLSKKYFNSKVFSTFRIKNAFKGNVIIKQYTQMNNFIFIKEGILELSLQNSSFVEFHQIIQEVKEIIIRKAKELKINLKDLFDFDLEVDSKTSLHMNTIKGILNQKQTFLFHRNENGVFGDYEFFFDMPTILTGTIISDKCLFYQYDKEKYNRLTQETYLLNDSLKNNSFLKLKSLLKRMIMVYNSYWHLSMEQLEKKLQEKEDVMHKNENLEKKLSKKTFTLSKRINNIPFLNTYGNNKHTNYKNVNSLGGDSPSNKKYTLRGIESTNSNFNKWKKMGEPVNSINKTSSKYKINTMNNKNMVTLENQFSVDMYSNKTPNYKSYKFESKIFNSKNKIKKNDNSVEIDKSNVNEKKEIHKYKIINDEEYEKKLFEKFKLEMESRRRAKQRIAKKIFLPPLTCSTLGNYKSSLNFHNDKLNTSKLKKSNIIEFENIAKSKRNSINNNSNISFVINNSFPGNSSKIKMENEESFNSNNSKKINNNKEKKKIFSKETNKKQNNLKFAQLYNIISRKDKNKKK